MTVEEAGKQAVNPHKIRIYKKMRLPVDFPLRASFFGPVKLTS